jgi:hypothetical protein
MARAVAVLHEIINSCSLFEGEVDKIQENWQFFCENLVTLTSVSVLLMQRSVRKTGPDPGSQQRYNASITFGLSVKAKTHIKSGEHHESFFGKH